MKDKLKSIDIHSKGEYPSNVLSNFYPNSFVFDGVECASMEGFLQSLKTRSAEKQIYVCSLCGKEAKQFFDGKPEKYLWRISGRLYWRGRKINRISKDYLLLLMRAYEEMFKNPVFKEALAETKGLWLTHSIGKSNPHTTVLTEKEFIWILNSLRKRI